MLPKRREFSQKKETDDGNTKQPEASSSRNLPYAKLHQGGVDHQSVKPTSPGDQNAQMLGNFPGVFGTPGPKNEQLSLSNLSPQDAHLVKQTARAFNAPNLSSSSPTLEERKPPEQGNLAQRSPSQHDATTGTSHQEKLEAAREDLRKKLRDES